MGLSHDNVIINLLLESAKEDFVQMSKCPKGQAVEDEEDCKRACTDLKLEYSIFYDQYWLRPGCFVFTSGVAKGNCAYNAYTQPDWERIEKDCAKFKYCSENICTTGGALHHKKK